MANTQNIIRPLTVYKASAGSGKTFTLAVEYIKLLLDNTKSYEKILAVTFTNKATEEMKSRILSQLYGIAHKLPDSNKYMKRVCDELGITSNVASERAEEALYQLLHNYNFFRVQTIDTFFQSVVRNLAKELSLNNNLRIALNDRQVINSAVDSLMESLANNKELMNWVVSYINEKMDDGESWDVTKEIKGFGTNLTKEFYKRNRHKLEAIFNDSEFFIRYKKELREMKNKIEEKYKSVGKRFYSIINANGLTIDDFSKGTGGPAGYFVKLAAGQLDDKIVNSYIVKAVANHKGWARAKDSNRDVIDSVGDSQLVPLFLETEATRTQDAYIYNSISKTLNNINNLRLLHAIEEEMVRQNGIHSRFMLSDTQTTLNELMKDDRNVAPFIYEKIGSYIDHIMIDEFQDTSNVQWKNFRMLLEECMSRPKYDENDSRTVTNNLIVGDVKQSIYRFRSGDWRLLNNIDDPDTGFDASRVNVTSLQTNYRSQRKVVEFNNLFFYTAHALEADRVMPADPVAAKTYATQMHMTDELFQKSTEWAEDIRRAYADVRQLLPEEMTNEGFVKIQLMNANGDDTGEKIMAAIVENIRILQSRNIPQKDIAILVRKNRDIPNVAEYFNQNAKDLKLVSQEAFRLDSSPAVLMLVAGMRLLAEVNVKETRIMLARYYARYVLSTSLEHSSLLSEEEVINSLPKIVVDEENRIQLISMPLTEMAETLFRSLELDRIPGQTIYLSTFFDCLSKYVADVSGSLAEFLHAWDEDYSSKTIGVGEIDGIRIMSMHKSKGLQFKHLIIPFCNWNLLPPFGETLWCEAKEEPFSELPFIPVEYKNDKSLRNSIYEVYGSEEYMQEIVDSLNLLYVAFTRAENSLIVISDIKKPTKDGNRSNDYRATLIADTLSLMSSMKQPITLPDGSIIDPLQDIQFEDFNDDKPLEFIYGEIIGEEAECQAPDTNQENQDEKTANVFERNPDSLEVKAQSYDNAAVQFRQSNKSRDFADDITDEDDSRRYIHNGTILHQVFSTIETIDDVDRALRELEFDGMLYNSDTTPEEFRKLLMQKFENEQVADWFSPRWRVFNECTILHADENGKPVEDRPDRVITDGKQTIVIDYKFGKPHKGYSEQVERYMERLNELGMPDVKGFIWYVNLNKVDAV